MTYKKFGDVIVIRGIPEEASSTEEAVRTLRRLFPNCQILLLPPGADIERLDEAQMEKLGWVRKDKR